MIKKLLLIALLSFGVFNLGHAQDRYELNDGWKCMPSTKTKDTGAKISSPSYSLSKWQKAVVPAAIFTYQQYSHPHSFLQM